MTIEEATEHLKAMMLAMYQGRSVRAPSDFKHDVEALRVAAEFLDRVLESGHPSRTPGGVPR